MIFAISTMESTRGEESGEIYSSDEQGEYTPEAATPKGAPHFSVQELKDMLMTEIPDVQFLLSVEFALQLEVMMADCPGCPCPPIILIECRHGNACTQE